MFDYGEPEYFILFVQNFNMTLAETGTRETDSKINYLCTLFQWEALHQFDLLCVDVENTDISLTVDYLLRVFAWYFFL